jgi:hypothetical protein
MPDKNATGQNDKSSFRQFLEEKEDLKALYTSMSDPREVELHKRLSRMVQDAYARGDHEAAERLDAQLEELEERMDDRLEGMDDGNRDDDGGEDERLDRDWSVQGEMARIYAKYLAGQLDLDEEDTVEVDPEEAKRMGWEYRRMVDHNAKPIDRYYRYVPTTKTASLAKMLRGAIWESPNLSVSRPNAQKVRGMSDEQIIDAARDAYESRRALVDRIRSARGRARPGA